MNYELIYIVPAQFTDAELPAVQAKIAVVLETAGAKILRHEAAGKLKLAYPIKHGRFGQFFLAYFEAEKNQMAKVQELLRMTTEIARFQIAIGPRDSKGMKGQGAVISFDDARRIAREDRLASSQVRTPASSLADAAPVQETAVKSGMSLEDLDKKLDQILNEGVK